MNLKFEKAKLKRELSKSGKEYDFYRVQENEFGEKNGESIEVGKLKAIYHETNGHISSTKQDSTLYRKLKIPMLLCLYEDATFLNIGDTVTINGRIFKVTGLVNVQEWNIIGDVSLEVVDDGKVWLFTNYKESWYL